MVPVSTDLLMRHTIAKQQKSVNISDFCAIDMTEVAQHSDYRQRKVIGRNDFIFKITKDTLHFVSCIIISKKQGKQWIVWNHSAILQFKLRGLFVVSDYREEKKAIFKTLSSILHQCCLKLPSYFPEYTNEMCNWPVLLISNKLGRRPLHFSFSFPSQASAKQEDGEGEGGSLVSPFSQPPARVIWLV